MIQMMNGTILPQSTLTTGPVSAFFQPADDDPPEVVLSRLDGLAQAHPAQF
jgi:hypothetical protein